MAKIITIHSFRGGTGKSTITSNLAVQLALQDKRVLIIDTDVKSPGVHALFGLDDSSFDLTFNDYLHGDCSVEQAVYDVSYLVKKGALYLTPSAMEYGEIASTLVNKYSYRLLKKAFSRLIDFFELDYLIVDTHPGINEETLLSAEMSDEFLVVVRPDNQDYQGARVSIDIAKKLKVRTSIILNKVHGKLSAKKLVSTVESLFECRVVGTLPFSTDVLHLGSQEIFSLKYPRHVFSSGVKKIVTWVE